MTIYKRYIEILTKRFRLGPAAALPSDKVQALAEAVEERFKEMEKRYEICEKEADEIS